MNRMLDANLLTGLWVRVYGLGFRMLDANLLKGLGCMV
jgi:hypothetical protein